MPTMVEKAPSKLVEKIPKQKELEVVPNVIKGQVIEKKALEFLKFIKHSK